MLGGLDRELAEHECLAARQQTDRVVARGHVEQSRELLEALVGGYAHAEVDHLGLMRRRSMVDGRDDQGVIHGHRVIQPDARRVLVGIEEEVVARLVLIGVVSHSDAETLEAGGLGEVRGDTALHMNIGSVAIEEGFADRVRASNRRIRVHSGVPGLHSLIISSSIETA